MHARKQRRADRDRAHGARIAPVDARLAVEDLAANDLRFHLLQDAAHHVGVGRVVLDLHARLEHLLLDLVELAGAQRLRLHAVGVVQVGLGERADLLDERLVARRRLPFPVVLAGFVGELVDRLDRDLHLLVAEHDGAQHHVLGKLVGFRFDHQHRLLGAGDDEVQLRGLELGLGRVQDVLAVDVAHARGADRAVERDARERHRGGGAEHRRDVGIDFRVDREHGRDDLHLVVEAAREERAQRPVDEAAR